MEWLRENPQAEHIMKTFEESKKKDDLADCLNQAIYYRHTDDTTKTSHVTVDIKSLRPRKPTATQERRGYSPSNLWYFFSQDPKVFPTECRKQGKMKRAAIRHFGDVDTCISLFESRCVS